MSSNSGPPAAPRRVVPNGHQVNGLANTNQTVLVHANDTATDDNLDSALATLDTQIDILPIQTLHAQVALSQAHQAAAEATAAALEAENALLRGALAEAEEAAIPARARARALQRVSHRKQRLIDLQWLMLERKGVEVPPSVLGDARARTVNGISQARGPKSARVHGTEGTTTTNHNNNDQTAVTGPQNGAVNTAENDSTESKTTETIDAMTLLASAERSLAAASDALSALGALLQAGGTVGIQDLMGLKGQIDGLHRTWAPLPAYFYAHAAQRGNARGQTLVDGMGGIEAYWTKD